LLTGDQALTLADGRSLTDESLTLLTETTRQTAKFPRRLVRAEGHFLAVAGGRISQIQILLCRELLTIWILCSATMLVLLGIILLDQRRDMRKCIRPRINQYLNERKPRVAASVVAATAVVLPVLFSSCSYMPDAGDLERNLRLRLDQQIEEAKAAIAELQQQEAVVQSKLEQALAENKELFEGYLECWTAHVVGGGEEIKETRERLAAAERVAQVKLRETAIAVAVACKAQAKAAEQLEILKSQEKQIADLRASSEKLHGQVKNAKVCVLGSFAGVHALFLLLWGWRCQPAKRGAQRYRCPSCLSRKLKVVNDVRLKSRLAECEECNYQIRPRHQKMLRVCFPTVGFTATGKTYWLAKFHNVVRRGGANEKNMVTLERIVSPNAKDKEHDAAIGKVERQHDPGATHVEPSKVPAPLVFYFEGRAGRSRDSGLLNIFDFGGATMFRQFEGKKLQERALRMEGFLYFLDPSYALGRKGGEGEEGCSPEQQLEVLEHLRDRLRETHRIPSGKPIHLPVAVCIPKIDKLESMRDGGGAFGNFVQQLFAIDAQQGQKGRDRTARSLEVLKKRHDLFRYYCNDFFPGWDVDKQMHSLFAGRYMFFPMTSKGFGKGGPVDVPYGIVEPVLWLLYMNGMNTLR